MTKKLILSLSISFIVIVLVILYGPFSFARTYIITTAMNTSEHKFIAKILYPDAVIDNVMKSNKVIKTTQKTSDDSKLLNGNKKIEIIDINKPRFDGILAIINDPSRVKICAADSENGELLENMADRVEAKLAINASGYLSLENPGVPVGLLIVDGKILYPGKDDKHTVIGLSYNNKLILGDFTNKEISSLNLRDAVEFGPLLIVNGVATKVLGNGGGYSMRAVIGQRKDGAILMLVTNGRTIKKIGATMKDVQDIMIEYGAQNAANLDGGSSVSMIHNGKIINSVVKSLKQRMLPCAFYVK